MDLSATRPWDSLLLVLLLVAGWQLLTNAIETRNCEVDLFRLPTRIQPLSYDLYLELNPNGENFKGKVIIDLNIREMMDSDHTLRSRSRSGQLHALVSDPKNIILNAGDLKIKNMEFSQEGNIQKVNRIYHDAGNKILVVPLEKVPNPGDAQLTVQFKGKVQSEAKGLFRMRPFDMGKWMLKTHFEPTYARWLFPCFDEPEFKSTFELTIKHPKRTTALSNMHIIENKPKGDFSTTSYAPTPKMPSYLLSLAVGEFDKISEKAKDSLPIFIYAPKNWAKFASTMLKQAVKAYDKVADFFKGLPQPLKKIDFVTVSLGPDAVESWGLISMKLKLMFTQPHHEPYDWNYANTILMLQLIHQRLANIVTIRWWDELWLKEGLAAHLASELTTKLHPEISNELYTLLSTIVPAMIDDDDPQRAYSIKSLSLKKTDEIEKLYHTMTYGKSQAIFRMFSRFLGKEKFDLAIRKLIKSKAYGHVDSEGWWHMLSSCALEHGKMLANAEKWTLQKGYPTIFVSLNDAGELLLRQKSNLENEDVWPVPISYEFQDGSKHRSSWCEFVLLNSEPVQAEVPPWFSFENEHHWLKFNRNYEGYYRVVYESPSMRNALAQAVKLGRMRPADRFQLISDSYAHGKQSGSMEDFGRLLESFEGETEDGVILLLVKILTELHKYKPILASSKAVNKMMMNYHTLNGGVKEKAGPNILKQYARGQVLDFIAKELENPDVIDEARNFMANNRDKLPSFLKYILLSLPPQK